MSIGDKLRSIDEHAGNPVAVPPNQPPRKEPAEGSRETSGGGVTNRAPGDEQQNQNPNQNQNQNRAPRRGKAKGKGNAQ
jgi:hypothetical protein